MKTVQRSLAICLILLTGHLAIGQPWMSNLNSTNPTFFEIQEEFDNYWKDKNVQNGKYIENGVEKKAYGWKQFKRWEWHWEQRVGANGQFPSADILWTEWQNYQSNHPSNAGSNNARSANWTSFGPSTSPGG